MRKRKSTKRREPEHDEIEDNNAINISGKECNSCDPIQDYDEAILQNKKKSELVEICNQLGLSTTGKV